jgi:hypothetical protein
MGSLLIRFDRVRTFTPSPQSNFTTTSRGTNRSTGTRKLESQSLASFHTKSTDATWKSIPTSYLLCEDDLAIPATGQEAMTKGVKDMGGDIEVTRIKSGHSPFLSKLDETVEWIRRVAGGS